MKFWTRPNLALVLPLAVVAAAALVALNEIGYRRSTVAALVLIEEQETRMHMNMLLQQVLDAETGQRGFLLTGDEKYLAPYSQATEKINGTLDKLRSMYQDEPAQLVRFSALSRSVSRKLAEIEVTVKLRQLGGDSENWLQVVRTDLGRGYMNSVRESALALVSVTDERLHATQLQIDRSLTISRIGVTLAALLGLLAFVLYLRQTEKLNRVADAQRELLAAERAGLEKLVRERTTRLTVLANHLQRVQELEREHLARELHDELGALLTAAKLDVARIRSKLAADNPLLTERVQHLSETLNAVIALKRKIVEDLRPSSLSNLGLIAALEILVREFGDHTNLHVSTDLEAVEISADAELTVYRVVQESLTNISKYAQAKEVIVTLHAFEQHVELTVTDDGVGFDLDARLNASHGFSGMRHRVEALRGALNVQSTQGAGTRVEVSFPLPTKLLTDAAKT